MRKLTSSRPLDRAVGAWRALAGITLALVSASTPAVACTMASLGIGGPFWTGSSWLFALPSPTIRGGKRLVERGEAGQILGEWPMPEARLGPMDYVVAASGDAVWRWARCSEWDASRDDSCGRLVLTGLDGSLRGSVPAPADGWPAVDHGASDRIRAVRRNGSTAEIVELRIDHEPAVVRRFEDPRTAELERERAQHRRQYGPIAANADRSVAWVEHTADLVRVVRFDADGKLALDREYPRANPNRLHEDGTFRLGAPWRIALASDGSIALGHWQIHPDCSADRPNGFVVLGPRGETRAEVSAEHRIESLALSPDDQLLTIDAVGTVRRFDLDGRVLGEFSATPEAWANELEAFTARAAAAGPEHGPAEWLAVRHLADPAKAQAIRSWLIAAGVETARLLDLDGWNDLGAELCAAHSEAPVIALRRFDESPRWQRPRWLAVLVGCWSRPPPGALEYALDLARGLDGQGRQAAARAFERWNEPEALTDDLWRQVLEPSRPSAAGQGLLQSFDRTGDRFDRLLRRGTVAERQRVRQLLFESMQFWRLFMEHRPDPHAAARGALIERARVWASDDDPRIAATGRLLLVGHRAAAPDTVPTLLDDATREPELRPRIARALVEAGPRELPRATVLPLLEITAWWEGRSEGLLIIGMFSQDDPVLELALRLDADGHEVLARRGLAATASPAARSRLIAAIEREPRDWQAGIVRRLLDQPWLVDGSIREEPERLLHAVARRFAAGTDLHELALRRYRELFGRLSHEPVRLLTSPFWPQPGGSPLLRALQPADVAALVERAGGKASPYLWLVAEVGAWPAVEQELTELLDQRATGLAAAAALSALGNPRAIDLMVERGLTEGGLPARAVARQADLLRPRIEAWIDHENERVRRAVRQALLEIGPSPGTLDRLTRDAERAFSAGTVPDLESLLILDSQQVPVLERFIDSCLSVLAREGRLPHRCWSGMPDSRDHLIARLGDQAAASRTDLAEQAARLLDAMWANGPSAELSYQLRRLGRPVD